MKDARAEVAAVPLPAPSRGTLADFVSLTKPRLNLLVVATSAAGYYLGAPGVPEPGPMLQAVAGTALVAAGAAVLNQVARTRHRRADAAHARPGRFPTDACCRATRACSASCCRSAASRCSPRSRTSSPPRLALATLIIYLAIYTPLKRRTSLGDARRRRAGRAAAAHRMDRFARQRVARRRRALRDRVPLADSAFHGDRVDVPRRLREGRLSDAAGHRSGGTPRRPSGGRLRRRAPPGQRVADARRRQRHRLSWRSRSSWGSACSGWRSGFAATRTDRSARRLFFGSITYLPILWIAMIANRL